jgi:hypothetical protein
MLNFAFSREHDGHVTHVLSKQEHESRDESCFLELGNIDIIHGL